MSKGINNGSSWDAALLAMSLGGRMRRISWDWDNRFVFSSNPGRYPFPMKLKMCYSSQCNPDDWENWEPTKEDKSANDWVTSMKDKNIINKENEDLLSSANKKYKRMEKEKCGCKWHWSFSVVIALILWIVIFYAALKGY